MSPFKMFGSSMSAANSRGSPMYSTLTHQAPEVLLNNEISFAGDVYSLGVLMWQVRTGFKAVAADHFCIF